MLILKGFFRKKNVKIYLIILTFIFSLFILLIYNRNHFIKEYNKFCEGDIIYFKASKNEYSKIKKLSNIKTLTLGLEAIYNNEEVLIIRDYKNKVSSNEAIILYRLEDLESINLAINNKKYNFKIKDYHELAVYPRRVIISKEDFDKLNTSDEYIYIIEYKNYFESAETNANIIEKIKFEGNLIASDVAKMGSNNYEFYINILTIFIYILISIFTIILIITIYNIIIDEKKNVYLLSCLGFNKKTIRLHNIIKIFSLIISAMFLSIIVNILLLLLL